MPPSPPHSSSAQSDPGTGVRALDNKDVDEYLRDPSRKQAFVTPMFDVIAPRYDDFTRRFSFGLDVRWKRDVIEAALDGFPSAGRALDVACGTGDLAYALAAQRPACRLIAIDASSEMIAQAARRPERRALPAVEFRVDDVMKLQLPDSSVDLVTAGYALRNVPDWRAGLRELVRVLRPGGRLVTLDFYRPEFAPWRALYLGYLRVAGDLVGWRWHGRAVVYGYIARSIRAFVSWQEFSAALEDEGFQNVRVRRFLGGGVAIHSATLSSR